MPSAQVTITQLPQAGAITGTEAVPIVQNGQTVQTTTAAIAASPSQNQTFLTLNQESTLPNSRSLSVGSGLTLTDGGAQGALQISFTGSVASLVSSTQGLQAKIGDGSLVGRTITGSNDVSVTNGNGVSGNPTIVLTGAVGALAGLAGTGILGIVGGSSVTSVEIQGTANQIDVANGFGPGNPTISIVNDPIVPGTGAMTVPTGTTGDRSGSPVNGMFRYNSDTETFEGYANNAWGAITTGTGVTSVGVSGGTTGLTTSGGPITSSGTITFAGTLITSNGGTGLSSYTAGDTLYYSTGTALSKLAIGASTYVMTSSGTAPQWSDPSGLTVGNATTATNIASGTANQIVYQTGAGATSFINAPTIANTYLEWSGSAFQWSSNPLGTVTSVGLSLPSEFTISNSPVTSTGTLTAVWGSQTANYFLAAPNGAPGTPSFRAIVAADIPTLNQNTTGSAGSASNIIGGTANQIPYQTAATTTSFITAPTSANTFLEWSGSAFQWTSVSAGGVTSVTASAPLASSGGATPDISLTGTVATGNGGTGLSTYTAGDLVYYATGTALSKLGIGASTYLLTSSGTAPQWSDPTGVTVGTATNASNVAVSTTTTNASFYLAFVDATTGNQAVELDTDLTYNPSTNTLTAGTVVATVGISGGTF
jgi:hypothetical protein